MKIRKIFSLFRDSIIKYFPTKLFNRIMLYFFIAIFITIAFLTTITTYSIYSVLKKQEVQNNKNIIELMDNSLFSKQQDLKQTLKNIYTSPDIKTSLFLLLNSTRKDLITSEYVEYSRKLYYFLNQTVRLYSNDLCYVLVYNLNADQYYGVSNISSLPSPAAIVPIIKEIARKTEFGASNPCFSQNFNVTDLSGNKTNLFILYTVIVDYNNLIDPAGFLVFVYKASTLQTEYKSLYQNAKGHFFVFTDDNKLIINSGKDTDQYKAIVKNGISSMNNYVDKKVITEYYKWGLRSILWDKDLGIYIVNVLPNNELYSDIYIINGIIILLAILCLFICLAITYKKTSLYSFRTQRLIRSIELVKDGKVDSITTPVGTDEISNIHASFNDMCVRLNQYIQEVYVAGLKEKQSEINRIKAELREKSAHLYALQMQINPHFLYNTLEVIRMNCLLMGEDRKVAKMIRMLSQVFRSTINTNMVISFKEEFDLCQAYLQIFQLRYPDNLKVIYDIDPQVACFGIIKYIMVPIIENSFVHGIDFNKENCIILSARMCENNIILVISDNGKGIEASELEKINANLSRSDVKDVGIGLVNVQKRISMVYGNNGKFNIESKVGFGVKVTITIQAITVEELKIRVQNFNC